MGAARRSRRKSSGLTGTDQFAGCGGTGQVMDEVLKEVGGNLVLAMNHWKLATQTYATNQVNTDVACTDIQACDPRRFVSTDILCTSPECTTHSPGGGNTHKQHKVQMEMFDKGVVDPATERSRATMWDVCRFAEYHHYNIIIVENVVEAKTRWVLFDTWLQAMHKLGYNHECVYLNSMFFFPTPQSRDRMYIVFWKQGNPKPNLKYQPLAYCPRCVVNVNSVQSWKNPNKMYGKYNQQYLYVCPTCATTVTPYYYASFNCIDWSDLGTKISERKKPLCENTIKRIQYGLDEFGKQPLMITTKYHSEPIEYGSRPLSDGMRTQTTEQAHGIFNPFIINDKHSTGINYRVKSSEEAMNTVDCTTRVKLIQHPFMLKVDNNSNLENARSIMQEQQTQVTWQTSAVVTPPPFIVECHSKGKSRPTTDPVNTVTAGAVKTGLVTNAAWNSFIAHVYGNGYSKHVTDPVGSIRTKQGHELVSYQVPKIEDCYYRMLKPAEIKLAMAFRQDYKILGSGKDQVKQLGNAVTPPVMKWLLRQCIKTLM